jgi:hypothetical protein
MQAAKQDGSTEFYLPYKGHSSADDFVKFCNDDKIWLQKMLLKKIYINAS